MLRMGWAYFPSHLPLVQCGHSPKTVGKSSILGCPTGSDPNDRDRKLVSFTTIYGMYPNKLLINIGIHDFNPKNTKSTNGTYSQVTLGGHQNSRSPGRRAPPASWAFQARCPRYHGHSLSTRCPEAFGWRNWGWDPRTWRAVVNNRKFSSPGVVAHLPKMAELHGL